MKADQLAERIGATLEGKAGVELTSCATLEEAQAGQLSFLTNPKYADRLETTQASAVIVQPNATSNRLTLLKAKDPYFAFCQAVIALHGHRVHPHEGVSPHAHVHPTATIGEGTVIYPGVFVGPRASNRALREGLVGGVCNE